MALPEEITSQVAEVRAVLGVLDGLKEPDRVLVLIAAALVAIEARLATAEALLVGIEANTGT